MPGRLRNYIPAMPQKQAPANTARLIAITKGPNLVYNRPASLGFSISFLGNKT